MKKLFFLITIIITTLFMVSCSSSESGGDSAKGQKSGRTESAPDNPSGPKISFAAYDLDGNRHTYDNYSGKPLIINFWGTWCPPCRREMPELKRIYDEYKPKDLEIVGLAVERMPNNEEGVRSFTSQGNYDWVMLMGDRETKISLGMGSGVPYTLFVDREGHVIYRHTGMMSYNQLKAYVEKII